LTVETHDGHGLAGSSIDAGVETLPARALQPNYAVEGLGQTLPRDLVAGLVVFFVALPLCLGVAIAGGAPPFAGVLAGIVGGIVVGVLSGSQTSVSGPSAGSTAVVISVMAAVGSFEGFLLTLVGAGAIQVGLGLIRAGSLAAFFPSSVVKGLLAAIGVILVLKQIPHLLGHDTDPEGEMAFQQPDKENTLSELAQMLGDIHPGAALIGLASVALLVGWDQIKFLKGSIIPAPLVVVLFGVGMSLLLGRFGTDWTIGRGHLVQVPVTEKVQDLLNFLKKPDFSLWQSKAVATGAVMLAAVATLETLLNLEAVDKIDPRQRTSPANRELIAQGVGNMACGLIGGIPIASVIVRSSVNINAGGRTKLAPIFHGILLLVSVAFLPTWLNLIPLSCLAAILLVTGAKLASPILVRQMWNQGVYQFAPFMATVAAIVLTDLPTGVLIGMAISVGFILRSNMKRPIRRIVEKHLGGEVIHIELANQVSFLNRASIGRALDEVPEGGQVLLDALNTDYIDPDVLDLIRDFREKTGPARGIVVSLVGFRDEYNLKDETQYVDFSTRELQSAVSPAQVLRILKDGNERFRTGDRLSRDLSRSVLGTAAGQHPFAVIVSCIDSRAPAELIFDLGVGDIFSVRVAGNVAREKVLGSVEYACAVAGAKLVVVMGHTRCGAVTAAVDLDGHPDAAQATGCDHISYLLREIQEAIPGGSSAPPDKSDPGAREAFVDEIARLNVLRTSSLLAQRSSTLARLIGERKIGVIGAMYNVSSGAIEFLDPVYPASLQEHAVSLL
jgi:carbonic anhydrase/SulP family sulfate permease